MRPVAWGLGALTCVLTLLAVGTAFAEGATGLSGTWVLDENASDDPTSVINEASRGGSSSGIFRNIARRVSVFGIPVGSLPLPSGSNASDPEEAASSSHADYTTRNIMELRILQEANVTEIQYDGTALMTYVDGIAESYGDESFKAHRTARGLAVSHELEDGTRITELYALDSSGNELIWTVTLNAKRSKKIEIRRQYERLAQRGLNLTG